MYPRVAFHRRLRAVLVLTTCFALLPLTDFSLLVRSRAQGQSQTAGPAGRPTPGKPEGTLPDLDEIKKESHLVRQPRPPIPSTIRSPKLSLQPWNGRRVGDPDPNDGLDQTVAQVRRAHSRVRRAHSPKRMNPPFVPDDQFIQNFFSWALLRSPIGDEPTYWNDQFRVAYG